MPRASELEEFGLEVESEHHALINEQRNTTAQQRQPLELTSPTKSQVKLLASTNKRYTALRPGMLKWALLVLVLAFIVFLNLGQEREETNLLAGEEVDLEELEAKVLEEKRGSWKEDEGGYRVFGEKGGEDVKGGEKGVAVPPAGDLDESDEDDREEEEEEDDEEEVTEGESNQTAENAAVAAEPEQVTEEIAEEAASESETTVDEKPSDIHISALDLDPKFNRDHGVIATIPEGTDESNNNLPEPQPDKENTIPEPVNSGSQSPDGKLTNAQIAATRTTAQNLITLLEEYYYGASTTHKMLLHSWVGPWDFDSPNSTQDKMVQKLVDTMIRALVTPTQTEFIVGTIGSSVAAGHDNCNYDSYENQLQRTLGPVWSAAGMKFTVQNAGEGGGCGDTFANQVFCIKQNVSPKIDVAHYSWSYFEVGDHDNALAWRESLVRWTQMMPRQPPVHVINVEGHIPAAEDEKELQRYYAMYGYNAFYMRYAYREGGYDYDGDAANGSDRFGWHFVGDGYHNTTRYGELEEDEGRRESLGVLMRNWHPGPLGFQLISDAFSIVYSKAILAALDIVEKIIADGHDPSEIWSASQRKIVSKRSLPEPLHCDSEYCTVDEGPGCLNYELPTYGVWGPRVEDPNDDLNPHKGELQNWEVWYEPRDFWHLVAKEDVIYFQDREDKEICKHLDNCAGISATSPENGMVVFRLPKMEVGLVAICGCCGDKEIANPMFLNNSHIEVRYNGEVLDRSTWDLFPNPKCARLLKRFPTEGAAAQTPTGHAYLSIKVLDGIDKPVRISHVITL